MVAINERGPKIMSEAKTVSRRLNPKSGFTIMELLVVISIVAILALVLFPVYAKARANRGTLVCANHEKQIALAILQYTSDADGTFPIGVQEDWNNSWPVAISPYLHSLESFHCPEDHGDPASWLIPWAGIPNSYAANGILNGTDTNGDEHGFPADALGIMAVVQPLVPEWQIPGVHKLAAVTRPANTILIGEKHNSDITFAAGAGNVTGWGPGSLVQAVTFWDWAAPSEIPLATRPPAAYPNGPNGCISAHHEGGRANFAFCDGHVKLMSPALTNPHGGTPHGELDDLWDSTR